MRLNAGTLDIGAGGSIGSGTIFFDTETASLRIDAATAPINVISNFVLGATIDLHGIPFSANDSTKYAEATGELDIIGSGGGTVASLFFGPGNTLVGDLSHVSQESGGTGIVPTNAAPCFLRGTRILTDRGDVSAKALSVGDRVVTAAARLRPVKWIGCRHLDLRRRPAPERVQPIRNRPGAFGRHAPRRDLLLSPDHAVVLDGLLLPNRLLVNGACMARDTGHSRVAYYHVELDAHDIVLAENLPVESYLDTGNRNMFSNEEAALLLHPNFDNDQARREAEFCMPYIADAARVEQLWQRLATRAVEQGWRLPTPPPTTDDPALHLLDRGLVIKPIHCDGNCYSFFVPRARRTACA